VTIVRKSFVTIRRPFYSRLSDDVRAAESLARVDVEGKRVTLVPESATPTQPYLLSFDIEDILQIIKEQQEEA
jgi:hypothetical protein